MFKCIFSLSGVHCRTDSRFAPSQWKTALHCNDVSHWLGAGLESALHWMSSVSQEQCMSVLYREWYMYLSYRLFQHSRVLFWCLFPELRSNEGNKHQNNTRVSTETVCHKSTHIILFVTRQNESINDDKTMIFTHHSRVSLSFRSADDVIIDCQWRHNDLTIVTQSRE